MIDKKTRVRQVFGRQRIQAGDKTYVFEMSKSGVSVCATGRGQVESSKTFAELLSFIAGVELMPCVVVDFDTVEKVDDAIEACYRERQSIVEKIETLEKVQIAKISETLRRLGTIRATLQTGKLL